jgi:anaerobic selenocysteine-containing dehydrogenase
MDHGATCTDTTWLRKPYATEFYVIDPLKTGQLGKHLAIKPNTDGALALGIANYLITSNMYDKEHVEKYTHGFEQFREAAKDFSLERVSKITDLSVEDIRELAEDLYRIRPSFIHLGFGIQKHLYGGEAARTIALLPPLVGGFRVHYSNTDREIDLAFLQGKHLISPEIPKTQKMRNMAQLGKLLEAEEIKFLFVFNTNPLVNLPNQALVKKGMESEDLFTVVHDIFLNDTCSYADIVLPAPSFLESFDIHICYYHNYLSIKP